MKVKLVIRHDKECGEIEELVVDLPLYFNEKIFACCGPKISIEMLGYHDVEEFYK